jgi:hypothetical protein
MQARQPHTCRLLAAIFTPHPAALSDGVFLAGSANPLSQLSRCRCFWLRSRNIISFVPAGPTAISRSKRYDTKGRDAHEALHILRRHKPTSNTASFAVDSNGKTSNVYRIQPLYFMILQPSHNLT